MEVVLLGIPPQVSLKVFHQAIMACMDTLLIESYVAEKYNQSQNGHIIFTDVKDAQLFLRKYKVTNYKAAKLKIMGCSILVKEGRNLPGNLDVLHVKSVAIQRKKYREEVNKRELTRHLTSYSPILIPFKVLSCGKCHVRDDDVGMEFCPEDSSTKGGILKFGRISVFINLDDKTQAEILYDSIWEATADNTNIVFVLQYPPRFFRRTELPEIKALVGPFATLSITAKKRAPPFKKIRMCHLPAIRKHKRFVSFCLAYKLQLSGTVSSIHASLNQVKSRRLFNLVTNYNFTIIVPFGSIDFIDNYTKLTNLLANERFQKCVPFSICFQLQLLVSGNYLPPNLVLDLASRIQEHALKINKRPPFAVKAFQKLLNIIPYPTIGTTAQTLSPDHIFSELKRLDAEVTNYRSESALYQKKVEETHVYVLKANVTPTRIVLSGPEPESKNRVLRKYAGFTDYFLRVQFCDEDYDEVRFGGRISNEELMTRFKEVFRTGIQIAGRVYKFLGFSHSSLRSHSAWFVAAFWDSKNGRPQTFASILSSLGDFKEIRTPARCAARIGQAFSETPISIPLKKHNIIHYLVPDIKSADGMRIFSDGVGSISYDAVQVIWKVALKNEQFPTCFQIRWGGAKGMLALDSELPDRQIRIREESMVKFKSQDLADLEICDMAYRPLPLVLNRQMIKILEDMGVCHKWFLNLQRAKIEILRKVTADPYNVTSFLRDQGIGRRIGLDALIRQLHAFKIDYRQDQFLRRAVEMSVLRELRQLKNKARIPVRQGTTLFGIVDETGYLAEGEVYICIGDRHIKTFDCPPPIYGRVLVTRSPALHPGDIQGAIQNTPPSGHPLRELSNCIVFSRWGDRDLPSQLSGGDLDGDIYNVIWDPDVVQLKLKMFKPADYLRSKPKTLDREVTSEDMAEFFVDFMKTDQLGIIANRHQILADQCSTGTLAEPCLKLAKMHSNAVDFSKTGIPVDVNMMPKPPRYRPDFMAPCPPVHIYKLENIEIENPLVNPDADPWDEDSEDIAPAHRYYASPRILGKLYRNIDERQIWDETKHSALRSDHHTVWAVLLEIVERMIRDYIGGRGIDWYTKQSEAEDLKNIYEDRISNIMRTFSPSYMNPLSETEVFCGFIFNRSGHQSQRQRDLSCKIGSEVDALFDFIIKQMRPNQAAGTQVYEDPDTDNISGPVIKDLGKTRMALEHAKDILALCLACYQTQPTVDGYRCTKDAPSELRGFKVIAASCLVKQIRLVKRLQERMFELEGLEGYVKLTARSG